MTWRFWVLCALCVVNAVFACIGTTEQARLDSLITGAFCGLVALGVWVLENKFEGEQ